MARRRRRHRGLVGDVPVDERVRRRLGGEGCARLFGGVLRAGPVGGDGRELEAGEAEVLRRVEGVVRGVVLLGVERLLPQAAQRRVAHAARADRACRTDGEGQRRRRRDGLDAVERERQLARATVHAARAGRTLATLATLRTLRSVTSCTPCSRDRERDGGEPRGSLEHVLFSWIPMVHWGDLLHARALTRPGQVTVKSTPPRSQDRCEPQAFRLTRKYRARWRRGSFRDRICKCLANRLNSATWASCRMRPT